jgi:fluoroquinolone transport system permease protein
MNMIRTFRTLGPLDAKNIRRDSMLVWMPLIPLIPALLVRWGVPRLTPWLMTEFGVALEPYYALLMSGFVLLVPSFAGFITGFLLLDERDDRTLMALLVTPLPVTNYLLYRIAAASVLGVLMTMVIIPLAGLTPIPLLRLFAIALLSSLIAPITALFMGSFAENKVAGFALVKFAGGLQMIPLAAYFITPPWETLAGFMPSYWPLKVFWLAVQGSPAFWLYLGAGFLANLALLWLLLRRFETVMRR